MQEGDVRDVSNMAGEDGGPKDFGGAAITSAADPPAHPMPPALA